MKARYSSETTFERQELRAFAEQLTPTDASLQKLNLYINKSRYIAESSSNTLASQSLAMVLSALPSLASLSLVLTHRLERTELTDIYDLILGSEYPALIELSFAASPDTELDDILLFCQQLASNTTLERVTLLGLPRSHDISRMGLALAEVLQQNTTLKKLSLQKEGTRSSNFDKKTQEEIDLEIKCMEVGQLMGQAMEDNYCLNSFNFSVNCLVRDGAFAKEEWKISIEANTQIQSCLARNQVHQNKLFSSRSRIPAFDQTRVTEAVDRENSTACAKL
jgi:hypothetical protein